MAFVCDQVLRGRVGITDPSNPTIIYLDPANGVVQSTLVNVNLGFFGGLDAQGANPNIQVFTSLSMDENTTLAYANGSSIFENGNNLFINAPGNVVIANLDLSNVNIVVNLNAINSALNNLNSEVLNLQNTDSNLSNSLANVSNQANSAFNQANSALNTANSAFNGANSALNIANNAYNQANSATILAGSAYNQANDAFNLSNSYQNSLSTNQLLVSGANLQFKVNLSSSPQVSFNANGATLPFVSVERNFNGDFTQAIHEPSGLGIIHSYTTLGSESVPYLAFSDSIIGQTSSIYFGSADPNVNVSPDGGSMYLRNNGDILMGDGSNWISYLGALVAFNSEINALQSIVSFRDSQEIFVSADGSDITGNGSSLQPYATIQKAITEAELVASSSSQVSIYVGAGTYTENLLISTGYISIIGETSTAVQSGQYGLTGDISINITTTDDLFQNFTILQGLVVRGSVVDNSTREHSLTLQDCRIVVPNTRSYAVKVQQNTVDKRVRLINCSFSENSATAFTDSLVEVQGGWLYLERCDLTTRSLITAVELGTGSYLPRMALCSIECGSSSASLPPQIFFNQDVNPPDNTIQSIGQTTIVAPVGGGATGVNGLNTAIHIRTGVATTSFSIYGVICGIANNPGGNDIITNFHGTAVPLVYADFLALPGTASKIGANFTKLPMTVVA